MWLWFTELVSEPLDRATQHHLPFLLVSFMCPRLFIMLTKSQRLQIYPLYVMHDNAHFRFQNQNVIEPFKQRLVRVFAVVVNHVIEAVLIRRSGMEYHCI